MKKLICNEVVRCQPASLQKELFRTSSFMYFAFIFSECITITSSKEALKVREHNFFQGKVVLLIIYLFNHDSSKSTIFMLNRTFVVLLSVVFLKEMESFVSCNIKLFALCFNISIKVMFIIIFYFGICVKFKLSTIISTRKG